MIRFELGQYSKAYKIAFITVLGKHNKTGSLKELPNYQINANEVACFCKCIVESGAVQFHCSFTEIKTS